MSNANDFEIENGVLKSYKGRSKDVVIPEGVTCIGKEAFRGRWSLKSITIPESVTRIKECAFWGCKGLTSMMIPQSVVIMDDFICSECKNLTSVIINCTVVGKNAFRGCGNLDIFIPGRLTHTEPAFTKCECTLHLSTWTPEVTRLMKGSQIEAIYIDDFLSLPANYRQSTAMRMISDDSFDFETECGKECLGYLKKNAENLCQTVLVSSKALFFMCEHNLIPAKSLDVYFAEAEKSENPEIKAILLDYQKRFDTNEIQKARKKREKERGDYEEAFLSRFAIREPSKGIEAFAFAVTGRLTEWYSRDEIRNWLELHGAKLVSSVTRNTDYLVSGDPSNNSENNQKAKKMGVKIINETEFNNMVCWRYEDKQQIKVPNWVKEITNRAFKGCINLEEVWIPEGVNKIGFGAFDSCTNLKKIMIPDSVQNVEYDAFNFCLKLSNVSIPEGIIVIEPRLFVNCRSLTSFTVPKSVKEIGNEAFKLCKNLEMIRIPDEVTKIDYSAFWGCDKLTIFASDGSYAEEYAKEHNIPFVAE